MTQAMETTYAPFVESHLAESAPVLRERMQRDGYLFFRELVEAAKVVELRRQVLEICAEAGWLDLSQPLMNGVANPNAEPVAEGNRDYGRAYRRILQLADFDNFPADENLMRVMRALLGDEVLIHPRRMGRVTFPNNVGATTPAHQDHFYIRGSVETYSCWVPLGACPRSLGGLAVAAASQQSGFLDHDVTFPGAVGGRGVATDDETVWHTSDFALGDALFFHSYTIHKALPNLSGNLLRLSTDNRYQKPKDEIEEGSLKMHAVAIID